MNKILLTLGVAAVALASCSSEEPTTGNDTGNVNPDGKYVAFRLSDPAASRAATAFDEGTPDEKAIDKTKLSFLFFTADDQPYLMQNDAAGTNVITPLPSNPSADPDAANTVVFELGTMMGGTSAMPAKVVAIANADNISAYANKPLGELLNATEADYKNGDGKFLMTSAASRQDGKTVYWSALGEANIGISREEAMANAVQIYVERVAAKVSVTSLPADNKVYTSISGDNKEPMTISYSELSGGTITTSTKELRAVASGWCLNTAATSAYGIKHLGDYSSIFANDAAWNAANRSFWETSAGSPMPNALKAADAFGLQASDAAYTLPNTADHALANANGICKGKSNYALSNATKILVGANIYVVDPAATELPAEASQLMLWTGLYYTPEALCRLISDSRGGAPVCFVRNSGKLYTVSFYTSANAADQGALKASAQGLTKIANIPDAQYWNGMAYYIVNIDNDLADKDGKATYGVVRNTSYAYTLENYIGLGTPVVDPAADIIPENPDFSETFIAARLNVLPWRTVNHSAILQ